MAKINEYFNVGDRAGINSERLLEILETMYKDLAIAVNRKPDVYTRTTDGLGTDSFLSNGDISINLNTNKVEMITNHPTSSSVTWTTLS